MVIRVLIADDHSVVREGLRMFLGRDPELEVVGEAADGIEAVERSRQMRPNVVLMDLRMPRLDGLAATKEIMITQPTPIVIVTASLAVGEVETSLHALRCGALAAWRVSGSSGFICSARRAAGLGSMPADACAIASV